MRQNRQQPAEATFHVSAHGNEDGFAVFADDHDRGRFLKGLGAAAGGCGWRVHAYCLMDTHYHLIVYTPAANLATGMARLNGGYAQAFNRRHGRRGHVFRDRYWSTVLETDEHLLTAMRYIARNPVAAGLCAAVADWPWSSFRATAGLETPPGFLDVAWTRGMFAPSLADACAQYRGFVEASW